MTANALTITPTDRRLTVQAEPLLVAAKDAARLCGISERLWRSWDSGGHTPEAVIAETGVKRWRFGELKRWVESGCPSRARWDQMQVIA